MRALFALLLACAFPLRAEEIRIEIHRGLRAARLEGARRLSLAARGDDLLADGKRVDQPLVERAAGHGLRLEGQELSGRVEVWARGGALVVVNAVDLEDYVAAVVASEVPPSWPEEALRAQAVAARTFAVAQKVAQGPAARAHLGASVLDQVYKGAAHPAKRALLAARATAGEVLTYGAAPIAAYFSASCGGVSEGPLAAFKVDVPYLAGGAVDPVEEKPGWTIRVSHAELLAALRPRVGQGARSVQVVSRTGSGRARSVRIDTPAGPRDVDAIELRQLLGYTRLPSLLFEVEMDGDTAVFRGKGSGHGVGLCQYGARSRALRGQRYREILAHYYPGAEIRRMY